MSKEHKLIPVADIEIGDIALRGAELENDQFKGLMQSIKMNGILQSIVVQPSPETPDKYRLIDGLQRVTIMNLLSRTEIPATIIEADETQVLKTQVHANLHRVNTKPAAYGRQIIRWMSLDPTLTTAQIAEELGVGIGWVTLRMNLHTLIQDIADRVDAGEIGASNAFALAKLPQNEQPEWVKRAIQQSSDIFVEACLARAKELKDAARAGRAAKAEVFTPVRRLRTVADIKGELDLHTIRAELVTQNMTAVDAFDAAIAWTLHQDPPTVAMEQEKWEADKKARDDKKAKKDAERAEKKAAREQAKKDKEEAAEKAAADARAAVTEDMPKQ